MSRNSSLLEYCVRNHDLHNGMILSTLSISSHDFAFGFSKSLVPMEMYYLLKNL